ncbi:hypothetical protein GHK33_02480 [Sinorhizobium meliloti]|uniref:hypothetical protein n=1 Tax=Rhizobium meliloti TaxID=382 RepID=UPI000FD72C6B|nr:hypothetical protein [Sinorhizobium meliloti]MQW61600.1 hypothetical protein [Sinorhizobium meliloti]RVP09566.1 hypothetical protein CN085_28335 [Sinorhizobium meliloti]
MADTISEIEAQELLVKLDMELRKAIPDHLPLGVDLVPDWAEPLTVLDLIQAEIAEGRPVVRKVRVADGDIDRLTGTQRTSQGSSAELTGSQPYTAVEALALTTEALALVFVSPVQMASRLMSTLSKFGAVEADNISVSFAAKKEQMPSPVLELDALTVDIARVTAEPLANELKKLSGSLGAVTLDLSIRPEKN